jgi:hypothetical protein
VQAAEKGGTENVEAHQYYLQGRFFENRHSDKNAREALTAYQHAVELDPRFAIAWAGVARTHTWIAGFATEGGQKAFVNLSDDKGSEYFWQKFDDCCHCCQRLPSASWSMSRVKDREQRTRERLRCRDV